MTLTIPKIFDESSDKFTNRDTYHINFYGNFAKKA